MEKEGFMRHVADTDRTRTGSRKVRHVKAAHAEQANPNTSALHARPRDPGVTASRLKAFLRIERGHTA
jgi:hypothetical protein